MATSFAVSRELNIAYIVKKDDILFRRSGLQVANCVPVAELGDYNRRFPVDRNVVCDAVGFAGTSVIRQIEDSIPTDKVRGGVILAQLYETSHDSSNDIVGWTKRFPLTLSALTVFNAISDEITDRGFSVGALFRGFGKGVLRWMKGGVITYYNKIGVHTTKSKIGVRLAIGQFLGTVFPIFRSAFVDRNSRFRCRRSDVH